MVAGSPRVSRTKHQKIPVLITHCTVRWRTFGGQREQALRLLCGNKSGVIMVAFHGGELMVIQPGAAQALIVP